MLGKQKNLIKKMGVAVYVLALVLLGGFLFLKDSFDWGLMAGKFGEHGAAVGVERGGQQVLQSADKFVIGYAFAPQSLNPLLFDAVTRSRLVDVYEGLVSTDRNLKIKPAIAVSFGQLDKNSWEFKLRPGVKFHDGRVLAANDVVASIEKARTDESSQLKDLLNTIEDVKVSGTDKVLITTKDPDPLLLNKLAVTYIFPAGTLSFEKPVGTGPYKFVSQAGREMQLESFSDYWGGGPYFKNVSLKTIADKTDRIAALNNGTVQLLTNVPPSSACVTGGKYSKNDGCDPIENKNIVIKSIPSLEVNFLIFNFADSLLAQKDMRSALVQILDKQFFVDLAFGYARESDQFVSSGVFGFNPEIKKSVYDLGFAKGKIAGLLESVFDVPTLNFDYPADLETVGQYVKDQFAQVGVTVNLNPMDNQSLQQKIATGKSDMYFLGWKSELGDSFDFLSAIGHSQDATNGFGQFNFSNYKNAQVDGLIEKSQHNLDTESRLQDLQAAMKILVQDDVIGIPLFESDVIFAFDKKINFEPRVDGYVHVAEIN